METTNQAALVSVRLWSAVRLPRLTRRQGMLDVPRRVLLTPLVAARQAMTRLRSRCSSGPATLWCTEHIALEHTFLPAITCMHSKAREGTPFYLP